MHFLEAIACQATRARLGSILLKLRAFVSDRSTSHVNYVGHTRKFQYNAAERASREAAATVPWK